MLRSLLAVTAAGLVLALGVSQAKADTVLTIDLNQFHVDVGVAGIVRTLTLSDDANTLINSIAINNVLQTLSSTGIGNLGDWTGVITATGTALAGTVSGSFILEDDDGDTYTVPTLFGTYVDTAGPNGVLVSALTAGGTFGGSGDGLFQGVDVSAFTAVQPLGGSVLQFFLSSTTFASGGADPDVDADITVVIPLPGAAWMGLALMGTGGFATVIRRRQQRQAL